MSTVYWFTGQPSTGKTTLSSLLYDYLINFGNNKIFHIDGDDLRSILNNYDYSEFGRKKNVDIAIAITTFLFYKGYSVIVSMVSPYRSQREHIKSKLNVIEIYTHSVNITERYEYNVNEYESPIDNYIDIDITESTPEESFKQIINLIK